MTFKLNTQAPRLLWASGLLLCMAAVHAAPGAIVTPDQQAQVAVGMTQEQVQQLVGRAAQVRGYANEPGPTWTYHVAGKQQVLFDVDFDANGQVRSAGERLDQSGRTHRGRG